jgi:hypothetical protein
VETNHDHQRSIYQRQSKIVNRQSRVDSRQTFISRPEEGPMKKYAWIISVMVMALTVGTMNVFAQDDRGNISGRVYNDLDGNGVCAGTGEPGVGGIGIQASSIEGNQMAVTTQSDGNYQLTTVAFGTWTVRVMPGDSWRVTSSREHQVVVNAENRETTGIDFCITQQQTVPPDGGAPIAQPLAIAALAGFGLLTAGFIVLWLGKRVI